MSDWTKQVADFQHSWMEQQQKFLTDWMGTLQQAGAAQQPNMWRQAIDAMEQQVNSAIETQQRALLTLAEKSEHAEGVPEAYSDWVRQLEEGMEMWSDMQHRLWQVWFEMLRNVSPGAQTPGETLFKEWQDMTRKAMSVQEEWLSGLTGTKGAAGKKTARSSTAKRSPASKERSTDKGDG